jgi:hypothetical protein
MPTTVHRLDAGDVKTALEAADNILSFRDFTPPAGLFVMILGRWRDDLRDALGMEPLRPAERGTQIRSLDEPRPPELSTLFKSVMLLNQQRFVKIMDDPQLPEMLEGFEEDLNAHKRKLAAPAEAQAS